MRLSIPAKIGLVLSFVIVLAIGGLVGLAFAADSSTYDTIPENTYIDGVDVSGMTEDEATSILEEYVAGQSLTIPVHLTDENNADGYDLVIENAVHYNVSAAVETAIERNHERSALSRIMDNVTNAEPDRTDITLNYEVDSTSVRELVNTLAASVYSEPADAYRDFNDDDTITLHYEVYGRTMDVDATSASVTASIEAAVTSGMSASEITTAGLTAADLPPCIIVNYDTTMLYVYGTDPTTPIFSCPIGYGRGTDEDGTYTSPTGLHYIEYKDPAPTWTNPDPDGWGSNYDLFIEAGPDNPLGLRAMKVSDTSMIFLHGVNDYSLVHNNLSHGCINIYNDDVVVLYDLIPEPSEVSTPIYVYFHGTQATYPGGAAVAYAALMGY